MSGWLDMPNRDEKGRYLVGHGEPGPGRKSKYDPAMNDQAYKLALLGMKDEEVAAFFDISHDTFYAWKHTYPAFSEALCAGRESADAEVARALYKRAVGMVVVSERALKNKEGEIVVTQTKTEIAPDTKAAAHWLGNRQRKRWTNAEQPPVEGDDDPKALADMDDDDLDRRIAELQARRSHDAE